MGSVGFTFGVAAAAAAFALSSLWAFRVRDHDPERYHGIIKAVGTLAGSPQFVIGFSITVIGLALVSLLLVQSGL